MMKKINLSKWLKTLLSLTLVTALLIISGCGDDDVPGGTQTPTPTQTQTLYELISADDNLTTFLGYIEADSVLEGYAKGTAAYTIFAPSNAAFEALVVTLNTSLDLVAPSIIDATLRFHFAPESSSLASITGSSIETVQGESVAVNGDGTISTGGSNTAVEVSTSDLAGTNGTLHVVENILIPPTLFITIGLNLGTVAQPFLLGADFTDILEVINLADSILREEDKKIADILLIDSVQYTVFLPTNAVLDGTAAAAGITKKQLIDSLTNNRSPLSARNFLLNQISKNGGVKGSDLIHGSAIEMMSTNSYTVVNDSTLISQSNPLGISLYPSTADPNDFSKHASVFSIDLVNVNQTGAGINGSVHVGGILQR